MKIRFKKIITIGLLSLIICGCELNIKKEIKCPEIEEEIFIEYSGQKLTSEDIVELYSTNSFYNLMDNLKYTMIRNEMKKVENAIENAEKFAKDTIKELKTYYGNDLLTAILDNTDFDSVESYEEYIKNSQLETKYVNNYILENNIEDIKNEEDIDEITYYKYYYDAISNLFEDNKLNFKNSKLNKQYKKYMENQKEYYQDYVQKSTEG